ncbi:hypothetical protein [uncultured Akkermansia sp.]|nr:hypothetical protein [uncultured Akkermansia sp.]
MGSSYKGAMLRTRENSRMEQGSSVAETFPRHGPCSLRKTA